jgi:hypothetical protein
MNEQLAFFCRRGHPITEDNISLGRCGEPLCKECLRIHLAAVRRWTRKHGWEAAS